jgi:hypothetical protein
MITAPQMQTHAAIAEFKPIADHGLLSDCTNVGLVNAPNHLDQARMRAGA